MPSPLPVELRAMLATEKRAVKQLETAYANISAELRRLENSTRVSDKLTASQLRQTRYAIQTENAALWRRVGDVVKAGQIEAAREAGDLLPEADDLFRKAGLPFKDLRALKTGMREAAATNVDAAMKRMMGRSYISLSKRVYDNQQLMSGRLNNIIDQSLLRGANAGDLAKAVRAYVRPDTPGGARYAAQRLARTEINNAFHAVAVDTMKEEPFVTAVKWNLSGSHKVPDECNRYAETVHKAGGEPGVYPNGRVPARPHPQCLCFTTPETEDTDDFIANFQAGKYDKWLEKQIGYAPEDGSKPTPLPVKTKPVETDYEKRRKEVAEQARRYQQELADAKAKKEAAEKAKSATKLTRSAPAKHAYFTRKPRELDPVMIKAQVFNGATPLQRIKGEADMLATKARILKDQALNGANPFNRTRTTGIYTQNRYSRGAINNSKLYEKEYGINCQKVSAAYEMRRRGYDVSASPNSGLHTPYMPDMWRTAKGTVREYRPINPTNAALNEFAKDEPDGARFLVYGSWKKGGAHIWNAEKVNGEVRFIEAQVSVYRVTDNWNKDYLDRIAGEINIMRVDDLVPSQDMYDAGWLLDANEGARKGAAAAAPKAEQAAAAAVDRVGSPELNRSFSISERMRKKLDDGQYKGGRYNAAKGWDSETKRALTQYTESGYKYMNLLKRAPKQAARDFKDFEMEFAVKNNKLLEKLISKNQLEDDVTVARGVTLDLSKTKVGDHIADPGFLSTTTDLKQALNFAEGRGQGAEGWTIIMKAPKGTNAVAGADYQNEIVFGPGLKQRVLDVDQEKRIIYTEVS